MKLSEIAAILARAGLSAPPREHLLELAGTSAGKRFEAALLAFGAGDHGRRDELEATVRVLATGTRATLQRLGCVASADRLVTIACGEQRRFFDALDAIESRSQRAAGARRYLAERGLAFDQPAAPPAEPPYYSFKIFGSAAALCVAEATTRTGNQHTVNIEGAIALGTEGGSKAFDWPNKIVVQLTVQEAYQVLALLENRLRSLRFDGHGRTHDKSLQIEFQDSHYFVRLIQRHRPAVAVPVRPVDAIPFISLLYKQLLRNEPHLRIDDIRLMVDRMAEMASVSAHPAKHR
jgi:hypothetical protein